MLNSYSSERCVFIVILNWNNSKDTIECIESVQQLQYGNYVTVLIDNDSDDNSVDEIERWLNAKTPSPTNLYSFSSREMKSAKIILPKSFISNLSSKRLVLIKSSENLGFAKGCNLGIEFALRNCADYVFLLNNDAVLTPASLSHLVAFMEKETKFAGVSADVRYYDRRDIVNQCGGKLLWYGARKYYFNNVSASKVPDKGFKEITFVNGCAALFRASLFQREGTFTERFFFGEEDFEFSWRLKRKKVPLACCFKAVVYHKVGSSVNKVSQDEYGKIYIHYLNRYIDVRQNTSAAFWFLWKYAYLLYIYFLLRKKFDRKRIFTMFKLLLQQSLRREGVDRKYFFRAMKGEFN